MSKLQGFTILLFSFVFSLSSSSQSGGGPHYTPDPVKVQMYLPYLAARHGGPDELEAWKQNNLIQYYQELWYYTESFSVKKDHLTTGVAMSVSGIDISRFEHQRLPDKEMILVFPGYRDALVLSPGNTLLYKPDYVK